jgi:lysophospholipase L1-like esterase
MIIGDSLAQGCRSLTVNADFCKQAWAARAANTQGWQFRTPDFPRPILFDLEQEIRSLGDLIQIAPSDIRFSGLIDRFLENLRAWLANNVESAFLSFDNLGLSGAQPYDLYSRTAASSGMEITALCPNGTATSTINISDFGKLHLALDGRFVLNPSHNPEFANMTPIQWVEARLPKRLFVQIGHNNGLYSIGADADPTKINFTQNNENGETFIDSFRKIAQALAELPAEVQSVVVVLLPKVGAVANLKPTDNARHNGYAENYAPVFSISKTLLPGTVLASVDQQIAATNATIQQIFTSAAQATNQVARLKFLDTFQLFESIDYKNSLDKAKRIAIDQNNMIDNDYVAGGLIPQVPFPPGRPPFRKVINRGGFESIDGMHPTGCGYAFFANKVMDLLSLPNNDLAKLMEESFIEDALLHDFPLKLDLVVSILMELRRAFRVGNSPVQPQLTLIEGGIEPHLIDIIQLAHQLFK